MQYRALYVEELPQEEGFRRSIVNLSPDDLPEGEVRIRVHYSSLNFKDALSAFGNKGVTKEFPHQPGIDAAGVVENSAVNQFAAGDKVIVTGFDLGMNTPGGLGQIIRVPAEWVLPCPEGMSLQQAMQFGTAGLTAQLCINKLERMGLQPEQGPVLVTGATGGVGAIAVALLAQSGYEVVASSGKPEQADYLKSIGASEVVDRHQFSDENKRPLLKEVYAGAIDVAGGNTLANVLKSIKHSGSVACCGLVENAVYPATVFPHILRNVNLLGVDSVEISLAEKKAAWGRLVAAAGSPAIEQLNRQISLDEVIDALTEIHQGKSQRHTVVDMQG